MGETSWYSAYIFDMDGTIFLGDGVLPTVAQTLERIRARNIPVRFLSNNPTKSPEQLLEKLTGLELHAELSEIANTLITTTKWLRKYRPDAVVFPIGEEPLIQALSQAGIKMSDNPAEIDIVLASYDRTFEYRKLQIAFDALWFHERAVLMSTNPDKYCPFPGGRGEPDCAAIVAAIEACTGVKCERTFGKPSALMVEVVVESLGIPISETIMVGDRLATDVAMGRLAGMDAALVLTGDSTEAEVETVAMKLRPTQVLKYLSELLPSH